MIRIIFLADIIGKIGRRAVEKYLPELKKKYKPHLVIANVENLAHGVGFTNSTLAEMTKAGVNIFTSGNHAWAKAGSDEILDDENSNVIRPANYPKNKSGRGFLEIDLKNYLSKAGSSGTRIGQIKLIVVNLLGKVYIPDEVHCPFKTLEKVLSQIKKSDLVIVDFHAEATSEKMALAQYFDGRVSAVIGTHTHVPTCDERILSKGTAVVSDAGMIGYHDSVIGADKGQIFNLFLNTGCSSRKHDLPDHGDCQFNAIYLEINSKSGRTKKIKRLDKLVKI